MCAVGTGCAINAFAQNGTIEVQVALCFRETSQNRLAEKRGIITNAAPTQSEVSTE
ncbi:MAG: hypothetical protein Q8L84_01420 [Hyphomonas sp.]|nr:hypothetical protein [Hyphomonas sp.]